MPRHKWGGQRGGGPPRGPRKVYVQPRGAASPSEHVFSMQEEARNTGHNQGYLGRDAKLRNVPITFINAGISEPLKELETEMNTKDASSKERQSSVDASFADQTVAQVLLLQPPEDIAAGAPGADIRSDDETAPGTGKAPDSPRSPVKIPPVSSLTEHIFAAAPAVDGYGSDSSEEVVVFTGRGASGRPNPQEKQGESSRMPQPVAQPGDKTQLDLRQSRRESPIPTKPAASPGIADHLPSTSDVEGESDDAIVADYLANIDSGMEAFCGQSRFLGRDLGGDDIVLAEDNSSPGMRVFGESESDGVLPDTSQDERLARILATQEELGMSSDEAILPDRIQASTSPRQRSGKPAPAAGRKNILGKNRGEYPSATKLADALDAINFDDRAVQGSSRKTKRNKGVPDFNVSDSEVEAALELTWQKDRQKKKEKRQAREDLRSTGLLNKSTKADPRSHYSGGYTFEQVKLEIQEFLIGDQASLNLPPMSEHHRKGIHLVANRLGLKSKSLGKGDQRFPVLLRTIRTMEYSEMAFENVFGWVGAGFFGVPKKRGQGAGGGGFRGGGGGGGNAAGVSYRDGEVVGGSAPELGVENKGRAMLEKMGWSTGTALGADHNKGILQPVAHVVKRTKAGLG